MFVTSLLLVQPKVTWSFITGAGPKVLMSPSVGFELVDPRATLSKWQRARLVYAISITALLQVQPEGYQEPHN